MSNSNYLPIKDLDKLPKFPEMFVVIAINVTPYLEQKSPYTSDPYCVWLDSNNNNDNNNYKFIRWPHPYLPTHWLPLPSVNQD